MAATLIELRVRNLGVIDDVTVSLGPGMTALTGETAHPTGVNASWT